MKILTVCRSGGEYRWEHVERLRKQCAAFAPGVEFRCLTDFGMDMPLLHKWPGWFAKMEMFRLKGPCLYFDLDTTIVGDLEPLLIEARVGRFTVLRDVYRGQKNPNAVQSSIMAWSGDMRWLYEAFKADSERFIAEYQTPPDKWGDQGFIQAYTAPESRAYWQDVAPGVLVSYKRDCALGRVPEAARVVVFHGKPRPWAVGQ